MRKIGNCIQYNLMILEKVHDKCKLGRLMGIVSNDWYRGKKLLQ